MADTTHKGIKIRFEPQRESWQRSYWTVWDRWLVKTQWFGTKAAAMRWIDANCVVN